MEVTRVVVMGLTGSRRSRVGRMLAERLEAGFVDAEDLRPGRTGTASGEEDSWPWLAAVRLMLRAQPRLVVVLPALTRSCRDTLRGVSDLRFIHLVDTHPALESLQPDETDVARVDARGPDEAVAERAAAAAARIEPGIDVAPTFAAGGPDAALSSDDLVLAVREIVDSEVSPLGRQPRILLVPPDQTRMDGRAGVITSLLSEHLTGSGCDVWTLPAVGTHRAMTPAQVLSCFGALPFERVLQHHWREHVVSVGEVSSAEISVLSGGAMTDALPIEVDPRLLESWDLVISIGQVVPHEVIGMANFTKNLVIGLGGAPTINGSHLLGALCDMEKIMGRAHNPVRDVVDAAFDRFLSTRLRVLWILTVVEATDAGVVQRGLFAGTGSSAGTGGAAYRLAAALSARCNIVSVPRPLRRVVCWIDPDEFRTTWLANKAVYRTRMALADGAELVLLAPGVTRFGEDTAIDRLIRRHGYRGTLATLEAIRRDPELAENLGAAAHLIHGSSEGRFDIVYCTDPESGGLSRAEVESVGYRWRPLGAELDRLGVQAGTQTGARRDRSGEAFDYLARPALGLWTTTGRI
jgi:nickel-dependent lactate racemase